MAEESDQEKMEELSDDQNESTDHVELWLLIDDTVISVTVDAETATKLQEDNQFLQQFGKSLKTNGEIFGNDDSGLSTDEQKVKQSDEDILLSAPLSEDDLKLTTQVSGSEDKSQALYCFENIAPINQQKAQVASEYHTNSQTKLKSSSQSVCKGRKNHSEDVLPTKKPAIIVHHNHSKGILEEDFVESLKNLISTSDVNAKMEVVGNDFVIAACTPLMERVHSLELADHIVFIDSSGNMDRYNCRVFLLMTDSSVGGLPLGLLISSSESESVITCGLNLLKEVFPSGAFNGKRFPKAFITDNCAALQNSLQVTFPNSSIWLCSFHILQSTWRWICNKTHHIKDTDRQELYYLFKKIVAAKNDEDFNTAVMSLKENNTAKQYSTFVNYIDSLLHTCEKWAHNFRQNSRGNDTNNVVKSAMNILKDRILNRTRACNVNQLFHYLTVSLPDFYTRKILDMITGRYNNYSNTRYIPKRRKIENISLVKEDNNVYTVKNDETDCHYEVNLELGLCSCPVGLNGQPCKHQHFVAIKEQQSCINIVPHTEETRKYYHWVATGSKNIPQNWYANLIKTSDEEKPHSTWRATVMKL